MTLCITSKRLPWDEKLPQRSCQARCDCASQNSVMGRQAGVSIDRLEELALLVDLCPGSLAMQVADEVTDASCPA